MDTNTTIILANEFIKESVVITYTDFLKAAKAFSLDSKEWGDLSSSKFFTTGQNEPWSETSDNGHGGFDLSWAFHKSDEQIEKLADKKYADILLNDVENFLDNNHEDVSTKEAAQEIAFAVANNLHKLEISSKYGNHAEPVPSQNLYFGETSAEIENQPKDIQAAWSNKNEPLQRDNLIVEGCAGTWYVINSENFNGTDYSLLEHEDYGDETACLIVDAKGELILDDVHNGFLDLEEYLDSQPTIIQAENLVEGWQWHSYNDGSGHLQSPLGDIYFRYDLSTHEVEIGQNEVWEQFDGNLTTLKTSSEQWVIENDLNNSLEDVRNKFRNTLSPKGQAEWDEWLKFQVDKSRLETTKDNTISRLFVDMDGTLATFTPVNTLETLYEPGYFANLEPQQKVIDAIKLVIAQNPNVEVNILSAYLTDSEFALKEKNQWLDKHIPELDAAHRVFVPCGEDKKNFIDNLKQSDYLLDDYTKNLTLWEPPATGIKLLNGINDTHGTWQGARVSYDLSPVELQHQIISRMHIEKLGAENDFMFKNTSAYINHDAQKLRTGNIIHTTVNLPVYSTEMSGKLFVVNEINDDGSFNAYKLTSNTNRKVLPHAVVIKADNFNRLTNDSFVASNELFEFPSDWKCSKLNGKLTQEQMQQIDKASQQQEQAIISFANNEPLADSDKARQIVDNLFNTFERNPEQLAEYLAFKAQFHSFSSRNTMLIYNQNPFATFVASKTRFEELGYKVQPHQQGKEIKALKPVKSQYFCRENGSKVFMNQATPSEKEQIKSGKIKVQSVQSNKYSYYNLYDISQTNCPKSDYPKLYSMGIASEQHNEYYNKLVNLMERMDVNVTVKDLRSISLSGFYSISENGITINELLDDTQKLSTMCHEAAHALLHKTSTATTEVKEFEAQCVAILFQSELGLPLEKNDVSYLCNYMTKAKLQNDFSLKSSLDRITKQVCFFKDGIGLDSKQTSFFNKDLANTQQRGAQLEKTDKTISFER